MSGKPRRPEALAKVLSNPQWRRQTELHGGRLDGPGEVPVTLDPPPGMDEFETSVWKEVAAMVGLAGMGVTSQEDVLAFRMLVQVTVLSRRCEEHLRELRKVNKPGVTLEVYYESVDEKTGKLLKKREPAADVLLECSSKLLALWARFGLTPSDRTKVRDLRKLGPKGNADPDNEFTQP